MNWIELFRNFKYWKFFQVALVRKEPACQCRRHKRHEFDSWVGKIPWSGASQPTPVFSPGVSHGRGAWHAVHMGPYIWHAVLRVTKSQTWLKQIWAQHANIEKMVIFHLFKVISSKLSKRKSSFLIVLWCFFPCFFEKSYTN